MLECAGLFHCTVYFGSFVGHVGVCGAVPASVRGERFVSGD